jgi:hypothetical protein
MATKMIQAQNTVITFDDSVYLLTPSQDGQNITFSISKNGELICDIYNNSVINWETPPLLSSIQTKGQHLLIELI